MSTNYAKGKPLGNNNVPFYDSPPPVKAVATTVKDVAATVSSILVLNPNTTAVEVGAVGGPAFVMWLDRSTVDSSVAATSIVTTGAARYDNMVPNNAVVRYIVPQSTVNTAAGYSSQVGANVGNGLYPNMAIKGTTGTSIISIVQYGSSNSY